LKTQTPAVPLVGLGDSMKETPANVAKPLLGEEPVSAEPDGESKKASAEQEMTTRQLQLLQQQKEKEREEEEQWQLRKEHQDQKEKEHQLVLQQQQKQLLQQQQQQPQQQLQHHQQQQSQAHQQHQQQVVYDPASAGFGIGQITFGQHQGEVPAAYSAADIDTFVDSFLFSGGTAAGFGDEGGPGQGSGASGNNILTANDPVGSDGDEITDLSCKLNQLHSCANCIQDTCVHM
jgi:flagellar motor protein MotB